ncbi:MAG TPA: carboxypeptidase-like regulatory domain-containing protein [Candidatus Angelobacter sp.]|nr:carboxypeptidase-like regulatory domain-containing protein [Candidatus Angelobacter sp.]
MVGNIGSSTIASSKYSTDTKHDGAFCFAAPEPGQYRLFASKAGYLNSSYIEDGPILEISSQQETLPPLLVGIAPLSGISGTVVDSAGEPLMNVNMVAVKRSEVQGRVVLMPVQGTQSSELGEFRIGNLVPGTYYVYAQPLPSGVTESAVSLVRTYYPTSLTLAASTPVPLGVGEEASGVLVHVQSAKMSHVAGRVLGPPDLWGGSTVDLHYADEDQLAMLYHPNLSAEGTYDFPEIAPGRYLLTVRSTRGGGHRVVDVSSSDVTADVEFIPNATVSGTWVVQGAKVGGVAAPRVDLTAADAVIGSSYVATVHSDGTFSATGVFPGRYFVKVSVASGTYLKQLRIGNRESFTGEVDLTMGRSPEIKIEIAVGGLTLSGDIKAMTQAGAKPAPNRARVVLVPRRGRTDGADIRFGAADGTGHFVFANLAPGDYQVFALLSASGQFLQNAKLLQEVASNLGKDVSVRGGGQSEEIELPLLSKEAIVGALRSHGTTSAVLQDRE